MDPNTATRSYSTTVSPVDDPLQNTLPDTQPPSEFHHHKGYFTPNANRPNLVVLLNAHATQLTLSGAAEPYVVSGVQFTVRGQSYEVTAKKEVILSAGAYGTPQLLELSGMLVFFSLCLFDFETGRDEIRDSYPLVLASFSGESRDRRIAVMTLLTPINFFSPLFPFFFFGYCIYPDRGASTPALPLCCSIAGIGRRDVLDRFEIPVKIDLPGVGENLQVSHPPFKNLKLLRPHNLLLLVDCWSETPVTDNHRFLHPRL